MPKKPPPPLSGAAPTPQVSRTKATEGPSPSEPIDKVGSAEKVGKVGQTQAVAGGRAVERVGAAAPLSHVDAVGRVGGAERIRDIAERLRRGDMTVEQAVEALIDDAVHSQMGQRAAPDNKVAARLREALASYVQDDPLLSARVRRLSKPR